mmetsp:Transcript_25462/g.42668  ORF Transcript_25462/g.42668 Transcript_25462/m.42668 type:complete len:415 (+) Transcript_25462:550-1794(+)
MEPRLLASPHHPGEDVLFTRRGDGRTEPVEHSSKLLDRHNIRRVDERLVRTRFSKKGLDAHVFEAVGGDHGQGGVEHVVEGLDELVPLDALLAEKVVAPEILAVGISDGTLDQNGVDHRDDLSKARAALGALVPAELDQVLQRRQRHIRQRRTHVLDAHGPLEDGEAVHLREGDLLCRDFPEDDTERVDVRLFVEGLAEHDFGCHPEGSAGNVVLVLELLVVRLDSSKTEIADADVAVVVNEQVAGLEVAVDDLGDGAVEPVHALGDLLGHRHALEERETDLGVVEEGLEVALGHELHHNGHVAGLCAGSHEEQHVGVQQTTADLHLLSELADRLLAQVLSEQLLHGHLLPSAGPSEHASKASSSNLLKVCDFVRRDLRRSKAASVELEGIVAKVLGGADGHGFSSFVQRGFCF